MRLLAGNGELENGHAMTVIQFPAVPGELPFGCVGEHHAEDRAEFSPGCETRGADFDLAFVTAGSSVSRPSRKAISAVVWPIGCTPSRMGQSPGLNACGLSS